MTHARHLALLLLPLALASGCGGGRPRADPVVPIETVPPAAVEAAKKALPGFTFGTIYQMKVEGKDAFEFRGKDKQGKAREVEVAATGEVLAIE